MKNNGKTTGQDTLSLFSTLFSSLPVPMIFVDTEGKILFINDAYTMYLKTKAEKVLNRDIREIIPNSRIPVVLKTGKAEFSSYHRYMDGPAKGQEAIVHRIPIQNGNGELIGCCGIVIFQNLNDLLELTVTNKKLRDELTFYQNELKELQNTKYTIDNILGKSSAVKEMKEKILKFSQGNSNILILGESGSGKELVAHSIHNCSKRSIHPFIRLNCAAIPENLFESEFFGYEGGAFTGAAKSGKKGKFELANKGTLFLDEIGELPPYMQAKLLRVLQEKEITRVGGNREIPVDVRVLAATNCDLEQLVREGKFREDLYFRLNILNIYVPPLRERKQDIDELVLHCLERLHKENGTLKVITERTLSLLRQYPWKGNIRELFNVVEKMYFVSDDDTIDMDDIPANILNSVVTDQMVFEKERGLDTMIEELEWKTVQLVLEEVGGNLSKTAEILKISRPRLYRILERKKEV
ncbi:MAG: sigma 54-interacting transcriptional regulator [Anaerotignum sp.]|nr:sigma 54-interacting transcriptional regulator [Anaerotignum sp.]